MKKNTYLAIIWSITLVCIVLGLVVHVIRFAGVLTNGLFRPLQEWNSTSRGSAQKGMSAIDDEAFSEIEISGSVAEITIETGDKFSVESTATSARFQIQCVIDGDTLICTQESGLRSPSGANATLTITVPKHEKISDLEIDLGVGEITVDRVEISEIDIDLGVGEIEISDASFKTLDIDNGTGDVTVRGVKDDYDIDVDNGIGDITVFGRTSAFEYHSESRARGKRSIDIDNGIGSVTITD